MAKEYLVTWEIDISAKNPLAAARGGGQENEEGPCHTHG
jgi:hypothetical protein